MNTFLFREVDNLGLALFRISFGFFMAVESFGALAIGWVKRVLVDPEFTFTFIGFEFLQPLPGDGMNYYYAIMGVFGLMIMLGFKYRFGILGFAVLWTGVFLMEKSANNNYYYLIFLLSWILAFIPAHRRLSIDALKNSSIRSNGVPAWCLWVLILQLWIVFTFAAISKLYPDWLNTRVVTLHMENRSGRRIMGEFLQQRWLHYLITYGGIIFDAFIIPAFLWKRTRFIAFIAAIFFHLFNLVVFQVGTLPLLSITFSFLFFSPELLHKRFRRKKPPALERNLSVPRFSKVLLVAFSVHFLFQIGLPLRHWFFKDDVLWTGEGRRLSWRMLVELKRGEVEFWVTPKGADQAVLFNQDEALTRKQQRALSTRPDMIWQMAQYIKSKYAEEGTDVTVNVQASISVSGGPYNPYLDPKVDLANVTWHHFKHHDWILPSPEDYQKAAGKE